MQPCGASPDDVCFAVGGVVMHDDAFGHMQCDNCLMTGGTTLYDAALLNNAKYFVPREISCDLIFGTDNAMLTWWTE